MLKITLINPPQATRYPQPPIGLALIAAILERAGYPVKLLDANALQLKPEAIAAAVTDTDVIGITAMTPTIGTALDIAHHLKQKSPNFKIILGGAHVTLLPEETLASSTDIDIIVRGEADNTVLDLLRALENHQHLNKVAGI